MLTSRFQHAFLLACEIHADQVRKGTYIPYLAHLLSVAALVLEHGGGENAAAAGLLHDAVEDARDGAKAEARIREDLGDCVATIVLGCSDAAGVPGQPKKPWRERKSAYLERLADEDDPDVLLVSACDKLHNARATVADLRAIGPVLWTRFSEPDPDAHLWYYESLAKSFEGRVPAALAGEFRRVLTQLRDLTAVSPGRHDPSTAGVTCASCAETAGIVRTLAAGTDTDTGSLVGLQKHHRDSRGASSYIRPDAS